MLFVFCCSNGGSKDGESLLVPWVVRVANPHGGPEGPEIRRLLAAGVPDPSLPAVEADVCLCM